MNPPLPPSLDPRPWLSRPPPTDREVAAALTSEAPDEGAFLALLRADPGRHLETMARRARELTRRHFGNAIALYAPLYLSDFCPGGCAYCGFASDRGRRRRRLEEPELSAELDALKGMGFEQILLLTGERTPQADFDYLLACVGRAAGRFHDVAVESFPMGMDEYRALVRAGCNGVTLYQETYDPALYARFHRWGPKRDYATRLAAPSRALEAGMRQVGLGALLGLGDPIFDALALWRHVRDLETRFWRAGVAVSFPRVRREAGGFEPPHPVGDRLLAQIVFAFRIALPDTPLVLSTREAPALRDGLAGVGISRMSAASRTTVGGYSSGAPDDAARQFDVCDTRDVKTFCAALRARGFDPVFKNDDAVYRDATEAVA